MVLVFWSLVLMIRVHLVQEGRRIASQYDTTITTGYQGERKEVSGEEYDWPAH